MNVYDLKSAHLVGTQHRENTSKNYCYNSVMGVLGIRGVNSLITTIVKLLLLLLVSCSSANLVQISTQDLCL
jgi:hypothetical protein